MAQIDNLEIVIASNASDAAQKINSLASSLSGLKGASSSAAGGLKAVDAGFEHVNAGAQQGANEVGNLGNKFTELGKRVQAAMGSTKGFGGTLKGLLGVLKGVAGGVLGFVGGIARIAKYRFIRTLLKDLGQSFKDLYGYSDKFGTGFADAMDKITTSTTYFRNSLAAMVGPLVELLAPALDFIIDKVVDVLNWFNQLFAALSGASTYTAARKVERAWSSTFNNTTNSARQAQKELKRTILGFDEINKLNDTTNSGSSGGSGSSPYTNGYELMFEQREIASGFIDFSNAIESALSDSLSRIEMIVSGASLGLGAILAFSGVNIPLGIALMVAGAAGLATVIALNWDDLSSSTLGVISTIEAAVGTGLLALGAVLAFSSVNIPLGIALMVAGAATLASAIAVNWDGLTSDITNVITLIEGIVAGGLLTIGAILAFSSVNIPLGIALMAAGAVTLATAIAPNWEWLQNKISEHLGAIIAIGTLMTVIGAILLFSMASPGIGLALLIAGLGTTITAIALNWDSIVETITGICDTIKEAVSTWWDNTVDWFSNLGEKIWTTIRDGIGGAVKGIGSWIKEHVFKPFQNMWNWLFGKPAEDEEEYSVTTKVSHVLTESAVGQSKDVNSIIGDEEPSYTELRQMGLDFGQAIRDGIKDKMSGVASEIFNKIKEEWTHGERSLSMSVIASVKRGDEWDNEAFMIATFWKTREITNARHSLSVGVEKSQNWDNVAWTVANVPSGTAVHYLVVGIEKSATWDNVAKMAADIPSGTAVHYLVSGIRKSVYWDNVALTAAQMPSGTAVHYLVSGVKRSAYWDNVALSAADMKSGTTVHYLISGVKRSAYWDNVAKMVADVPSGTAVHYLISGVKRSAYWDNVALSAADMKSGTSVHYLISGVKRSAYWDNVAKAVADMKSGTAVHYLVSGVKRSAYWDNVAWLAAQMVSGTAVHYLVSGVKRSAYWDAIAWSAAQKQTQTITITVSVKMQKDGWTTVEQYMKDNFGGATGGGGNTRGGGVGRFHVPIELEAPTEEAVTLIVDETESIWSDIFKLAGHGLQLAFMGPDADTIVDIADDLTTLWNKSKPSVDIAVGAVKDWTDSLVDYLGISDEDIAVYVDALSQWGITNTPFLSYLGIGNNLSKNVGVDAAKKWGTKSFLEYLGIDNLQTNVKVSAQVAERGNTITVTPGGSNQWVLQTKKMGGVYSNGAWSDIPQYASGTLNAGSIFAAGEAGPELVGHVGGRTEVLNKSQLAATMYSAVQSAMAPASANFAAAATQMYKGADGMNGEDTETLMEMVRQTNDATMRQNELLREQNDYLRQLNDKDFTAEITTSGISRAQARANRRAGTTVIPVGT